MTQQDVLDYIRKTPHNSNVNVVKGMLNAEGGGGGGGATIEALSVTENGTYTAPSGKAYSPVTVNVSGGSSDFSTATVTTNIEAGSIWGAFLVTLPTTPPIEATFGNNATSNTLVLYKGSGLVNIDAQASVTTSGAIEQVDEGTYLITGDCTITIS